MAVVFGAAVRPGGVASPALRRRTEHAAALWRNGTVDAVVASGGVGRHPPSEAAVMRAILQEAGVPASRIHLDERAATTMATAAFVARWLDARGSMHVVAVTERYHAPRAWLALWGHGVRARPSWPAPSGEPRLWPRLREVLGLPVYALRALALRLSGGSGGCR